MPNAITTQMARQIMAAGWPNPNVTDINPHENGPTMAASLPAILNTPKNSPI